MAGLSSGAQTGLSLRRAYENRKLAEKDREQQKKDRDRRYEREDFDFDRLKSKQADEQALRDASAPIEVQSVADGPSDERIQRMRKAAGQVERVQSSPQRQKMKTVTDSRLNGGRPTNIPLNVEGELLDDTQATQKALESGKRFQASATKDQAKRTAATENGYEAPKAKPKVFKAGGKQFESREEAEAYASTQNTSAASSKRLASALRKQGKVGEAQKLEDAIKARQSEGEDQLFDVAINGGDGEAMKAAYNAHGYDRLGKDDTVEVLRQYELAVPGGDPIPTADIQITRNGRKRVIRNVAEQRFKLAGKRVELSQQSGKLKRDKQASDLTASFRRAQLNQGQQRIDQQADQNESMNEFRRDQMISNNALRTGQLAIQSQTAEAQAEYYRSRAQNPGKPKATETARLLGVSIKDLTASDKAIHGLSMDEFDPKNAMNDEERAASIMQADKATLEAVQLHRQSIQSGLQITPHEAHIARKQVMQGNVARQGDWIVTVLPGNRVVPVQPYQAPPQAQEQGQPQEGNPQQRELAGMPPEQTPGDVIEAPLGTRVVPNRQPGVNTSRSSFYGN